MYNEVNRSELKLATRYPKPATWGWSVATLKTVWLLATFLAIFEELHGYLGDVLATNFFLQMINLDLFLLQF